MGTLAESSSGRGVRPSSVRSQPTVVYAEDGRKPLIPGSASLLLVTCRVGFPARWASRVDPVVALRAEWGQGAIPDEFTTVRFARA